MNGARVGLGDQGQAVPHGDDSACLGSDHWAGESSGRMREADQQDLVTYRMRDTSGGSGKEEAISELSLEDWPVPPGGVGAGAQKRGSQVD